jgi:ribosomal protein L12E/L44/L45/RPP1/RPP2
MGKIQAAQDDVSSGKDTVCNSLGAIANHVNAQTGKKISPDQAAAFWSALAGATVTDCAHLQKAQGKAARRADTEPLATSGGTDAKAEKKAAKNEEKAEKKAEKDDKKDAAKSAKD